MADQNQVSIEILSKMLKEMQKQSARYKDDDITNRVTRSRTDGSTITNRNIVNDFKRLGREVNHNIQAIQNSRKTFSDLKTSLKDMILPVSRMSKIYDEYKKSFKDYTRGQSDEFKKAANVTLDQFQKMAASGKSVSSSLSSLKDMQGYFNKSIENFSDGISNIDLEKDLDKRARELKSKRLDVIGQISKNKNAKKGTGTLDAELSKIEEELSQTNTQIAGLNKTNTDYINEYGKFVKEANSLHEQGIPILEGMNAADIDYATFMNKSNKEQEEIVRKLGKNIGGIAAGVVGFEAVLKDYKSAIDSSRKNLISSAKQAAMVLATVSATQLVKDYNATKKYNVESISPFQAGNMGMSQEELSTLIGQNKTFLRVAGNGNQNAMIDSGAFKELQNNAKQFGVYGKDAAELAAKFGNMQIQLGGSVDPTSIKNVMDDFKKLSDITEMTVDELVDYTNELNKNGTITALNQKYAQKNEAEKQAAIREEINFRYKLNKYMGYSIEHLKEQQQLQTNERYADLTQSIRKMVAAEIALSDYKANGGIVTEEEENLFKLRATNNEGGLGAEDQKRAESIFQRVSTGLDDRLIAGQNQLAKDFKAGKNFNLDPVANPKVMASLVSSLNDNFVGTKLAESSTAARAAKGLNPDGTPIEDTTMFGKNGKTPLEEMKVEDIGAASDSLTKNFNRLGDATTTLREKFTGFAGNPLGQASGALLSLAKNGLEFAAATRLMQALGGGAGVARGIGMGSSVGSLAMAGGVAGLVAIAGAVVVGLAAGGLIGSIINDLYENSDAKKNFEALHRPEEEGELFYMFNSMADRLSLGAFTPDLTEELRNKANQQWRDIAQSRQTIKTLNAISEKGGKDAQYNMFKYLATPEGTKLLSFNNDEDRLKDLGANDEVKRIAANSISRFAEEAIAGRDSEEALKIFKSIDENMKVLTKDTVKANTANDLERKAKELQANAKGSILRAIEDQVQMTRTGVGW